MVEELDPELAFRVSIVTPMPSLDLKHNNGLRMWQGDSIS